MLIKVQNWREERERERERKEYPTELQKPKIEAEVYNNNRRCGSIYTYTPINKIKTVQQK